MKKPCKIYTLDTETYNGFIGKLKKIAVYDGENVLYGNSFSDIEGFLLSESKMYNVKIYVHNLEFDSRKIPEIWDRKHIKWSGCMTINNKIATIKNKHWELKDSFKILPMSLKKLSYDFDVEHGKLDLWEAVQEKYPGLYNDIPDFLNRCPIDDELFIKYLGYDVISLYEVLEKLIEVSGLSVEDFCKISSTSSLSRLIFKKGYKGKLFKTKGERKTDYQIMTQYNWVDDLDSEAINRAGYYGGRTEVFTPIMNEPGYHFDENSAYPRYMKEPMPIGKPIEINDPDIAKKVFETWMKDHKGGGLIQAKVYVPMQNVPPLPCNMGKLAFPCGYIHGTWTYIELEYAILHCGVKILEYEICLHFNKMFPVFKNFIDTIYEIKEQASIEENIALRTFAKLIMNCGYGYTGMRRDDKIGIDDIKNKYKYPVITNENEDMGYIEYPSEISSEYIQVQIAAYVTSFARIALLKALKYADEKGILYYCDTDSVACSKPLPPEFLDKYELGKWDLESEPKRALYLKPKVYVEEFKEGDILKKFKGVSKSTIEKFTFESYEEILEEILYGCENFLTVETEKLMQPSVMVLQRQAKNLDYHEYRDKKMYLDNMEKRIMDYCNNTTEPYYFSSLEEFENFKFMKISRTVEFDMERKNHV